MRAPSAPAEEEEETERVCIGSVALAHQVSRCLHARAAAGCLYRPDFSEADARTAPVVECYCARGKHAELQDALEIRRRVFEGRGSVNGQELCPSNGGR